MNLAHVGLTAALALVLAAPHGGAISQVDDIGHAAQLLKDGQIERALDRVNAYLAGRPKDARGRFLKGVILTERKNPQEAMRIFTELTHEYPELSEPYNNLAVLHASLGDYEKARGALEMAIRTNPGSAIAHENLGDIYARMANQQYEKAAQLDRKNPATQAKLNLIKELFRHPAVR